MKAILSLMSLVMLLGCTLPPSSSSGPASAGGWENWQIQAGTAITFPPPSTNLYFIGALQVQGSQAAGVFSTPGSSGTTATVLDFTGIFDSTTQAVSLLSNAYDIGFTEPSTPYTAVPVNVTGGCVGVDPVCTAIFVVPSVGVQIAPLSGTYTGTLTESLTNINQTTPVISTGTGTLTLTQSSTPNSSGAFPGVGTIVFPANSDFGTYALTGTISGEGITLQYLPPANPVVGPGITFTGSTNPRATQITVSNLDLSDAGYSQTNAIFTGTLTLQ